jgi:hypothetical protein
LSNTCTSKLDHGFANLPAGKKTQHWKIIYKEMYRNFNFHHQVEVTHTFTHPSSLSLKIWNALGASERGSTCVIGSVESILPDCTSGSNVGLDKENHYTVRYRNLILKVINLQLSDYKYKRHDFLRYECAGPFALLQMLNKLVKRLLCLPIFLDRCLSCSNRKSLLHHGTDIKMAATNISTDLKQQVTISQQCKTFTQNSSSIGLCNQL